MCTRFVPVTQYDGGHIVIQVKCFAETSAVNGACVQVVIAHRLHLNFCTNLSICLQCSRLFSGCLFNLLFTIGCFLDTKSIITQRRPQFVQRIAGHKFSCAPSDALKMAVFEKIRMFHTILEGIQRGKRLFHTILERIRLFHTVFRGKKIDSHYVRRNRPISQ